MMPAAKHGDPQLGVDIHLCVVPPSPSPVPLPTPHMSVVFDPFDYVPIIGATITVCGMKRATAGTEGQVVHIPPGFPFAPKLPDRDDELFMGSATVIADGDPFSYLSLPVLGCQIAGMMAPFRPRKKGTPKLMVLPTTFNLAIPTSVFVGGPPTISLLGMLFKLGFAALGRLSKSQFTQALFDKFKEWRKAKFGKLKPGFLRCIILRAEPVNILTGAVSVEQEDFLLPGRIPLEWGRSYSSDGQRPGSVGLGWETPADIRLEVDPESGIVIFRSVFNPPAIFPNLPEHHGNVTEIWDGAVLSDHENEYRVRTKEDRVYHFPKFPTEINEDSAMEYLIDSISDLSGNRLDFERVAGNLVAISEPIGRRIEVESRDGLIRSLSLADDVSGIRYPFVRYEYDETGNLISAIDALGSPYTFAYDDHHLVRHTDRNGLSFYYEYDMEKPGQWRVVRAWGDGGLYDYRFEYIEELNERRITDSLGNVSLVKLDEYGLPINEIDPLGGVTIYEYDDVGRTNAVVDPDGHRTEYEYDERGNLLTLTRPDGNTIITEFSSENKAVKITDPNGAEWRQEWDGQGGLSRQISPLNAGSHYDYDAAGQLVGFTNPLGAKTSLDYDRNGNLVRLTDPLGHATGYDYDLSGNLIGKTDALGRRTEYVYDAKGRLTGVTLPIGASIACVYDPEDNLIRYQDENGAVTKLEYCGLGEIGRRIQPDGHTVEYHYDTEERLIGVTNQRGERYELKRDALGRIVEEVDYWGQARRYEYTASGYLKTSADPLERVIQYETDPLGRILKKIFPDHENPDGRRIEGFEYDANGNLTACENAAIRIERCFDEEGRLTEEKQGDACKVSNEYDLNGNRISRITSVDYNGQVNTNSVLYRYDALDQATGVEVEGHDPIQLTRNAVGQVTREQLSRNMERRFDYSQDGYLTAQQMSVSENPLFEQQYRYDKSGNLVEKQDSVYGVDRYAYDPLGRIISHLNPEGKLTHYLNDPAGDLLVTGVTAPVGKKNPLHDWKRDGTYEGTYYRFDRAGNLVERTNDDGVTRFVWDANQRLIESNLNGRVTAYLYDCLGRRFSKETDGVMTRFCWDGDALLGDALIGVNEDVQAEARLREWVYYPETFEPLILIQNGGDDKGIFYLYHNDPNGCPNKLFNSNGETVWACKNISWGKIEKRKFDIIDNPIRFQGQYYDDEISLCYNRYRYYDLVTGSFISSDPLGIGGGINLYKYAPNIWEWIDPLGLSCSSKRAFLSLDEFTALKNTGRINPSKIRFSQDIASYGFRDKAFGTIDDLASSLKSNKVDLSKFKPMRIVKKDGLIYTLDNRRLAAFQKAGVDIPYIKIDHVPKRQLFKFSTTNQGTSIIINK